MNNITILESSADKVKLVEGNLWMEPSTKKEDAEFWIKRFKFKNIPFTFAQYDTELMNERKEKMYRRVYGLFIDMKAWEKSNDDEANKV